jgi:hypothetical protein
MHMDYFVSVDSREGKQIMMSDTELWLAVGIPTVTVMVGILLDQLGTSRIGKRLQAIERDLGRFHQNPREGGKRRSA